MAFKTNLLEVQETVKTLLAAKVDTFNDKESSVHVYRLLSAPCIAWRLAVCSVPMQTTFPRSIISYRSSFSQWSHISKRFIHPGESVSCCLTFVKQDGAKWEWTENAAASLGSGHAVCLGPESHRSNVWLSYHIHFSRANLFIVISMERLQRSSNQRSKKDGNKQRTWGCLSGKLSLVM